MAVTHGTPTRTAIATAVLGEIDAGTAGSLIYRTSGAAEAATCVLSLTSGVVSGAVLTFNAITDDSSATGGTVDNFTIEDSSSVEVLAGSVATSGGDINLSSLSIGVGDTVSTSSLTYTAPV
jgi:hypothetical protein